MQKNMRESTRLRGTVVIDKSSIQIVKSTHAQGWSSRVVQREKFVCKKRCAVFAAQTPIEWRKPRSGFGREEEINSG